MPKRSDAAGPPEPGVSWRGYVGASVLLLVVLVARVQLVPLLGTQSPLLAFVLPVLVAAFLWGRGAAILVAIAAPVLVTPILHSSFDWQRPLGWIAHVCFFLLISGGAIFLIDQMQRTRRDLARSELRFRQLADAMPQIVYVLAPDRSVQYVNRRWREYTGADEAQGDGLTKLIPEKT